jgi:hypothetical protein
MRPHSPSRRWLLLLPLLLVASGALWGVGASSAPDLDLSGTWVLDLEQSEPVGPLLARFGVDGSVRAIAEKTVITQQIEQTADSLTITFKSSWRSSKRTIPLDGSLSADESLAGEPSRSRTSWGPDHQTIVSVSTLPLPDGTRARFVVTRSLPEPDAMLIDSVLEPVGGDSLRVRRLFRRSG